MLEKCLSPVCDNPVISHPRAVWKRRYCSKGCKMDTWVLRKAATMLLPIGPASGWELLQSLTEEDTRYRVKDEIVKSGAG